MNKSVIIPVKDQYDSLIRVLHGFGHETMTDFEIIVVDDGSSDMTSVLTSQEIADITHVDSRIIHQVNAGRAAARNVGIKNSKGSFLIFNDGDRVPAHDLIEVYSEQIKSNAICVGYSYDYFGLDLKRMDNLEWDFIERFSRLPRYYKEVVSKCDAEHFNSFKYPWMSFMVGNSCVSREVLNSSGLFDERFRGWGGEHFELGYRMCCLGYKFLICERARNYHIPHRREKDFYKKHITESFQLINDIHNEIDISDCMKYLGTNL